MKKNTQTSIEVYFGEQPFVFVQQSKKIWRLSSDISIQLSPEFHQSKEICIPKGFLTDFRSGPNLINKLAPKFGMWYVIHDWLYQNNYSSKILADREQDYWMRQNKVSRKIRKRINRAVSIFGCKYWNYYAAGGSFPYSRKKHRKLVKQA